MSIVNYGVSFYSSPDFPEGNGYLKLGPNILSPSLKETIIFQDSRPGSKFSKSRPKDARRHLKM